MLEERQRMATFADLPHLRFTSAAATILPTSTRQDISMPPNIRSLKATIRRKDGAGVMSMKCCSICRTERRRITVRSRAIIDGVFEFWKYRGQSVIKMLRAVGLVALAALSIALLDPLAAFAQAPQSKFAEVNGVRLHYLVAGKGDPVVLLHGYAQTSHMWLPLISKLADKHCARSPRLRSILRAFGRIRQGGDGAGHPRAGEKPQLRPHPAGRSRHRVDGGLWLCGAIPERGRSAGADGGVPARRRRLEQRVSVARSLAFPFLRQNAAGAGDGA